MAKKNKQTASEVGKGSAKLTPKLEKEILEQFRQKYPGAVLRPEIIAAAMASVRKNTRLLHLLAKSDSQDPPNEKD